MQPSMKHGIFLAVLAAGLYALNSPFSKLLLQFLPSTLMAGFLYLGAGLGILFVAPSCRLSSFAKSPESSSSRHWRSWPSVRSFLPATKKGLQRIIRQKTESERVIMTVIQ